MDLKRPSTYIDVSESITLKQIIIIFQEWWSYVLSRLLTLFIAGFLGALIGVGYAFYYKPKFTATTTFVLEAGDGSNGLAQYSGLASMVGLDLGGNSGGIFQGDNILELYKSRSMIQKTLLSSSIEIDTGRLLIDRYLDFTGMRENWIDRPELLSIDFSSKSNIYDQKKLRIRDSIIRSVVSDIQSNYLFVNKPDKKLSLIKVEVKASNEIFASEFNTQIVRTVNEFYLHTKTKKSTENIRILQDKVDSIRSVLNNSIDRVASISDATPNLNVTRQSQRVVPSQRSQISIEANRAVLEELIKNLELSKMAVLKESPLIQIVDSPIYPLPKVMLGKLRAALLGGIIAGFFAVIFFTIKFTYNNVLQ